jgi:hypothetical protein
LGSQHFGSQTLHGGFAVGAVQAQVGAVQAQVGAVQAQVGAVQAQVRARSGGSKAPANASPDLPIR